MARQDGRLGKVADPAGKRTSGNDANKVGMMGAPWRTR